MNPRAALLFATSGHSGVDRVVANILPELCHSSWQFDLVGIRGYGPHPKNIPANVTLRRIPSGSKKALLPGLIWYLLRHQPQTLLCANHALNRAALLARRLTGRPERVAIRMGMSLAAKGEKMRPRARQALFASMRRWYPQADAVIAPSHGVGRDLIRYAGVSEDRLYIIPNPIITEQFPALCNEVVDHSWFRDDAESPIILSVGSLEPRKDFATLIDAFARVRAKRLCRLVILGEGRERERLLNQARQLNIFEDVDLPGYTTNPCPYMRKASLFVLSSHREGSPVALVEALACGTPVVSTDCPNGPSETLQNGKVGKLVPVGDPEPMARAIEQTLDSPPPSNFLKGAVSEHRSDLAAKRYLQAMGIEE